MARLAVEYLAHHGLLNVPCRFDVVSIHMESGGAVIEVFQNAFDVS
jgi:Holliday junction resolvase-like predicted endonuclease